MLLLIISPFGCRLGSSTLARWARRVLPCLVAVVYYAHVLHLHRGGDQGAYQEFDASKNAVAWFLTYQVVALPVLGVEKRATKAGGLAQMALSKISDTVRWPLLTQILDELALYVVCVVGASLVVPPP
ncbi:hypothetical protein HOP50_05g39830 [Chloropicon primus]|nr:hypothetical protein HOP50_05g39830 [Chloropicon primus]